MGDCVQDRTLLVLTKRPIYSESILWDVQNPKVWCLSRYGYSNSPKFDKDKGLEIHIFNYLNGCISTKFYLTKSPKLFLNWLSIVESLIFKKKIIFIQLTYKILKQLSPHGRFKTVNNYWTRSSKISWFVSGEHISYLSKPKAEANTWSARQWQITIFCYNGVQ